MLGRWTSPNTLASRSRERMTLQEQHDIRYAIRLQRNVVVLLPRPLCLLRPEHGERPRDPPARRMGHDHLVNIATLRGHERRHETVLVFLGPCRDLVRVGILAE